MSVSLRERLLPAEFTRGDLAAPPRTLLDILEATARRYPDAPAIDDGDATVTYAESRRPPVGTRTRPRSTTAMPP